MMTAKALLFLVNHQPSIAIGTRGNPATLMTDQGRRKASSINKKKDLLAARKGLPHPLNELG